MAKIGIGGAGYRSRYLSHAKRALYHLSYAPCYNNIKFLVNLCIILLQGSLVYHDLEKKTGSRKCIWPSYLCVMFAVYYLVLYLLYPTNFLIGLKILVNRWYIVSIFGFYVMSWINNLNNILISMSSLHTWFRDLTIQFKYNSRKSKFTYWHTTPRACSKTFPFSELPHVCTGV